MFFFHLYAFVIIIKQYFKEYTLRIFHTLHFLLSVGTRSELQFPFSFADQITKLLSKSHPNFLIDQSCNFLSFSLKTDANVVYLQQSTKLPRDHIKTILKHVCLRRQSSNGVAGARVLSKHELVSVIKPNLWAWVKVSLSAPQFLWKWKIFSLKGGTISKRTKYCLNRDYFV